MHVPPTPSEEIRVMYVFTAPDGGDWGMTLESFAAAVQERNPDDAAEVWDDEDGPGPRGAELYFVFTIADEEFEGIARTIPQGVSIKHCTVDQAAEFAIWLRAHVVPAAEGIAFNTREGIEWDLPETPLPDAPADTLRELFLTHLSEVQEEDDRNPS